MKIEWNSAKMADVFDLQMGKTPDRSNAAFWNGSETWVAIGDMGESKYISSSKEKITSEAVSVSGIKRVPANTVIMSFKLSVGKVAIAKLDLYTNEAIMAFNVKPGYDILPEYVYYYLKGYKWQGSNRAVMGVTLNKASISQGNFKYPDSQEQSRIVAELDLLTGIIDKQNAQLKELDNLAQAIFYDMFGDPIENPKRWAFEKLENVCSNIVDCPHSTPKKVDYKTEYPCIRTSELKGGSISWTSMQYLEKEEYEIRIARLKPVAGDIVFGREGTIGDAVILPEGYNFSLGQRTMLLRANSALMLNHFLHRTLMSEWVKRQIDAVNVSSTVAHLNIKDFRQFNIPLPPLALQQSFAEKIQSIEKQKETIRASIADTQKLLDYTMDKYFG